MSDKGTHSFLLVRLGSLGDLVHTLPAVAALRDTFPNARIDWVVERKWALLLELVTGINSIIALDRSIAGHLACIRRLRSERHDCAIDFQGLYKSAVLAWLSGARSRIGSDRGAAREPGAARFYTERVPLTGRHIAETNLSLALRAGAERPSVMRFPLRVPDDEIVRLRARLTGEGVQDYVVVSPGGGWGAKCWPPERYGELCSELARRHGLRAVVNIGPGEESLAPGLLRAAGNAKPIVLTPSLRELAAILEQARIVVAGDSGPLHLAAALGTHVVALFGPTDPARNGPLPRGRVLRNASSEETSHKRVAAYSQRMLSLSVDQVLAAAEQEMSVKA
jgi:heptosyltransferase I